MKRIISLFLILALAIPLLSACAKQGESGSGESVSSHGNGSALDPTVPQNVDSLTYMYFIYHASDPTYEDIGQFGLEGQFYRMTNESKKYERILSKTIKEFAGYGTEFFAITEDNKLIRFPNIADVQEDLITYLRDVDEDAADLSTNGSVLCWFSGDEIFGVSASDGSEVFAQELKGVAQVFFDGDTSLVCRTDERYYVFDVNKKEFVYTGVSFAEQKWENEAYYELNKFLGNIDE